MNQTEQAAAVQRVLDRPQEISVRQWWPVALPIAAVVVLYAGILARLAHDWWIDPNFSHGVFVPIFSAYLIWTERERLSRIEIRPSWWGLPILAVSLCVLILGVLGAELFLSRSSFLGVLAGLVIYFLGWKFFRALLFPWAFLILMIPIPTIIFNQITFPLQILASKLAANILPIFNVPVLREGNVMQLPTMPLEVAEACSGIRSLLSLCTLAIIYGYFLERRAIPRILLAIAAIPIAVAANAFRIVGTGLMVQYWDPDKAVGFFHEFSGWVIFIASLLLLFGVHGLLKFVVRIWRGQEAEAQ